MSVESIFPFGRPVTSGDIVDRREFLAEMQQRLSDGHSLMLPGPRRIGKSSVAHEVLRRMRDTGAYTASVDLFYVTGIDEFAAKLMKSVLENRTGVLEQAIRAMRGMRTLWRAGAPAAVAGALSAANTYGLSVFGQSDHADANHFCRSEAGVLSVCHHDAITADSGRGLAHLFFKTVYGLPDALHRPGFLTHDRPHGGIRIV